MGTHELRPFIDGGTLNGTEAEQYMCSVYAVLVNHREPPNTLVLVEFILLARGVHQL